MPIPFPNLAYGLFDIFVSIIQVLSHYSLYSFLTRIWLEIAQFLFLFGKLQAAAVEDQIWELIYINQIKNLKMLGFTWKKKQNYWESPQAFDPHIFAIVSFVVDGVTKLVFASLADADGCWFSSIDPLAMFAKFINDSVYERDTLATGSLYYLNELIA